MPLGHQQGHPHALTVLKAGELADEKSASRCCPRHTSRDPGNPAAQPHQVNPRAGQIDKTGGEGRANREAGSAGLVDKDCRWKDHQNLPCWLQVLI